MARDDVLTIHSANSGDNMDVYPFEENCIISVAEFECELSMKDTKKLRDFLTNILKDEII